MLSEREHNTFLKFLEEIDLNEEYKKQVRFLDIFKEDREVILHPRKMQFVLISKNQSEGKMKVKDLKTKEEIILDIIEKSKQNKGFWQAPECVFVPRNPISKTMYKGYNRMALSLETYNRKCSNLWVTFNQAKDKGLAIKKSSKGCPILYYQRKTKNEENEDEGGFLKVYFVYNVDDLTSDNEKGLKTLEELQVISQEGKTELTNDLLLKADRIGVRVCLGAVPYSSYNPETDEIFLANYQSLAHELVHSTGCEKRLNRYSLVNYGLEKQKEIEECVAEIGALLLGQEDSNKMPYIRGYSERLTDYEKVVKYVIEALKYLD